MIAQGGEARMRFALRGDHTVLQDCYSRAPLHVRSMLGNSKDAQVLLLTTGGGLLGDDRLRIAVEVEDGAAARIGTVGATRLLPARSVCRQNVSVRLGAGSRLMYLPEPLIPCAGAVYQAQTRVELPYSATAILSELITPGRLASGERFAYCSLDLGMRVSIADRPVLVERIQLVPACGHLPAMLGNHTHLGSLLIAGAPADAALAARLHTALLQREVIGGATLAAPGLVVVRVLGDQAHPVQQALHAVAAHAIEMDR